ncbi:polysaccharide deacetylase [Eremococcus coleocola ACS-139-V-Col8]|uniref:Polysaccharide deacetylase n=1 Tax=Eremococcus coleocola ACS-139-V-Col8 TaxID=908337 RepID=E4KNF2_9LACT|nr:polysaccharide deacetylase family protein [Eremococcus coleocola]EFR31492.1 polysaccharide deacetylase [Eremococcus coleocola ACS-139-V-Col8]
MMKQWILLFCGVFFLLGCQNVSDIKDEGSNQNSEQKTDNKSETQNKDQSHSEIWTNYSDYAKLDQDGFAYTMVNDPDVSSEILPLNDSARNVVLFTFDDAPYEPQSHALQMAQLMKAKDVNAIFLVNGMYLEGEHGRKIVKEIFDMGFEIGNHTTTHPNMRELSYEDQYQEIKKPMIWLKKSLVKLLDGSGHPLVILIWILLTSVTN